MTKTSIILAALALSASTATATHIDASEMKELWSTWKALNNKEYKASEETERFRNFVQSYVKVVEHKKQNSSMKLALNHFADLSDQEFKDKYLGGLKKKSGLKSNHSNVDYSVLATPASVDWREKGAVTAVKNQANCGSCWSFSASGALEGLNAIKSGKLLSLSEQQLISCDQEHQGDCDHGGDMPPAFEYAAKNGVETEEDYPYTSGAGEIAECKFDASKAHHVNTGYKRVPPQDVDAFKAALALQPVAVSVSADESWRLYAGGVFHAECGTKYDLNHGVLGVGYGTVKGEDAFIVKNSWSTKWGDKGYFYVSTDKTLLNGKGACQILLDNSYPTA